MSASEFLTAFENYGSAAGQLIDLSVADDPGTTRYVDLLRSPVDQHHRAAAFEIEGQPVAFLVDARKNADPALSAKWIHRISFRGDAQWVALLRPGKLDVYEVGLTTDLVHPAPISDLPDGMLRLPALAHLPTPPHFGAVRKKLFELLRKSIGDFRRSGVSEEDAISLMGRGLFWRFLIDRHLVDGLEVEDVCREASDWPSCLATKSNALQSFAWLEETFNGGLLPLSASTKLPASAFSDVLADVARAATPNAQLRLPGMWEEVNFAHIPVGLLSEIYEAWAHENDPRGADATSVHYTPRQLVELVVAESLKSVTEVDRPMVLDPSAGAGVFLVAAFRALVQREWDRSGKRPSRATVRRILNEQLRGFDINGAALRLAELALYLTAIELDPESKPRPLKVLRFKQLRGHVLIEQAEDEGGSLAAVKEPHLGRYDLVIGNPPWTSQKGAPKKEWIKNSLRIVEKRLGEARASTFGFADNNPDLPFVYRAMEWAREGGTISMCLHARWLFGQSDRAKRARNDLLHAVHVTGILNGAALRFTKVWPGVSAPWCVLFARNEAAPSHAAFHFVSPQLEVADEGSQEHMRIDWLDASPVSVADLEKKPWLLKARFRGTPVDESAIEQVVRDALPLGAYLEELKTYLWNGYQVGGKAGAQQSAAKLRGLPDLKDAQVDGFVVHKESLRRFSSSTLLFPRDRAIYKAPLLLVRQSVVADNFAPRSIFSPADVAFHESFHGASFAGVDNGATIARYLQLVLQSRYATWFELLTDPRFGIERDTIFKEDLLSLPVVPWAQLDSTQQSKALTLSERLWIGLDDQLLEEIDEFVFDALGLFRAQRDAVRDTLLTARSTKSAKRLSTRPTSTVERKNFAARCERALNQILCASKEAAAVVVRADLDEPGWGFIEIQRSAPPRPEMGAISIPDWRTIAEKSGTSLATVALGPSRLLVAILDRYRFWTGTRAELLALSILADDNDQVKRHG